MVASNTSFLEKILQKIRDPQTSLQEVKSLFEESNIRIKDYPQSREDEKGWQLKLQIFF